MEKYERFSAPASRLAISLLAAAAIVLFAVPASAQSVERDMFVSVLNQADAPVLTLGASDFVVREDGRLREVLRARRASDVIDVALLVDTSQALGSHVNDVRRGIEAFIAKMLPQARISIIGLGDRPTVYTEYTSSKELLAKGVGMIFSLPSAGAYTLEAVGEVLKGIDKLKPERSAVVVVWAGGREFSNLAPDPLVDDLVARGTALHVIALGGGPPPDSRTVEGRNREILFDRGTIATGGRRENILTAMAFTDALDRLAAELLGQYRITFARPDRVILPRKTEVSVKPAGLTARGILIPARTAAK